MRVVPGRARQPRRAVGGGAVRLRAGPPGRDVRLRGGLPAEGPVPPLRGIPGGGAGVEGGCMAPMTRMRVMTYNIHRARGLDGQQRLDRIIDVLAEVDADIVALQEVLAPHVGPLAEATGMEVVFGQTRLLPQGPYGNVCLTRLPLVAHQSYSLTCRPFEPRGCLRTDVDGGAGRLHIFNVHLGLRYGERIRQVR